MRIDFAGQAFRSETTKTQVRGLLHFAAKGVDHKGIEVLVVESLQRRREDLLLLQQLLIQPNLDVGEIGFGLEGAQDAKNQGTAGTIFGIVGDVFSLFCWVARAVFQGHPEWMDVRRYMLTQAPPDLVALYVARGPELAARVEREPRLRDKLLPVFKRLAALGRKDG